MVSTESAELPDGDDSVSIEDGEIVETDREQVTVRRAPRYFRFMVAGVVLGVVVAMILTFAFPENDEFNRGQVFGFLLLLCGVAGLALGAVIAIILDRASTKRAATTTVEHSSAHPLG